MPDLSDMRRSYELAGLDESDLAPTWVEQLERWLTDADQLGAIEANAMTLATADAQGRPSARTVLLKGFDERGLVLYTNLQSRKGREAQENPHVALVLPWVPLQRQVLVVGTAELASAEESDAYFATRPHGSRLGAIASPQSQVVADREVLTDAMAALERRYPEGSDVPRPEHWGGIRVVPESVEFWQGRRDRVHDRLVYVRQDGDRWAVQRLAP